MISRYRVYLNDVEISSIDDSIYVADVSYSSLSYNRTTTKLGNRSGSYSGNEYFPENKVTVSFSVRQYDTSTRQNVIQAINAWCRNGGWLKVSDRPDMRMYVRCSKPAVVSSILRWTDYLTVELTAYDYPFWTDEVPVTEIMEAGHEYEIYVPGVYKTDVEAVIVSSSALTNVTIECGDTAIELDGINVPAEQPITISYTDDHHILQIESGGDSLLDKRTPDSYDNLVMEPGKNVVAFSANASAVCTLLIKGVYL